MRAEPAPPRPWLFSPALDLLVGCGAWSLPLLALTFLLQRESAAGVAFAFYFLALLCNQPHYMATIHRAYHTAEDFNKYRFFTVYVTVFAGLAAVLAHLVPGLFPWLVTLYLSWSPWHYTSQNFGIAQMMLRRAGAPADPAARQLLYGSYAASFAVWFVTLHTAHEATDPYFLSLRLPERLTIPLQILGALIFLVCAGAAFIRLARNVPLRSLAPALTLTLTQLLWFVAPALLVRFGSLALPASYFSAGALAFMHCAQYLWITGYYARQEAERSSPPSAAPTRSTLAVNAPAHPAFSFARYYLALVVGGIALFIPGPWLASRVLGHDFVESFMIFTALVNLHHFILDGAIWKLRDGRISRLLLGRNPPEAEIFQMPNVQTPNFSGHLGVNPPATDPLVVIQNPKSEIQNHLGWLFGPASAARVTRRALAVALLALAALDQWQFFSTSHAADAAALARAAAVNPNDPRPEFRRAQIALAAGDFAAARRELDNILARNPRNAPGQHLLGEVLLRSGDTAAALAHYDLLFALYPDDIAVAVNRGVAASAQHDLPKAVAGFERAVLLGPDNISARLGLASTLAAAGQPGRAVEEYEAVLALDDNLAASLRQADLLLAADTPAAWQRAEQRLRHAADLAATQHLFPEAAAALQRLADAQEKLGRPADAAKNRALAAQAAAFAKDVAAPQP